jgi:hypothetical protein
LLEGTLLLALLVFRIFLLTLSTLSLSLLLPLHLEHCGSGFPGF